VNWPGLEHPGWDRLARAVVRSFDRHPPLPDGTPDPAHCTACRQTAALRCHALTHRGRRCTKSATTDRDGHPVCRTHRAATRLRLWDPPAPARHLGTPPPPDFDRWTMRLRWLGLRDE
jgi:hypothetical protein